MLLNKIKIVGTMLFLGTNMVAAAENYYGPFDQAYNPWYGTPDNIHNPFSIQNHQMRFKFDEIVKVLSHCEYPASIHFENQGQTGLVAECNRTIVNIFQSLPHHLRALGIRENQQKWEWLIRSIYDEAKTREQRDGVDYGRAFLLYTSNWFLDCELRNMDGRSLGKVRHATGHGVYPSLIKLSRCIHQFMLVSPANDAENESWKLIRSLDRGF